MYSTEVGDLILGLLSSYHILMLVFAFSIMSSYLLLGVISIRTMRSYLKKNSFVNYQVILHSDLAPHLSLIAPAYNEALSIEENIQSLLSLNYNHYEVIVVNDGSKDKTLELMIAAYELEAVDYEVQGSLATKTVRQVYRSGNPSFKKLTVIDKVNGGKGDALNVGINYSQNPYVVCIDVDCILEKDALLKLAKPYLELSGRRVIATGGVVRIANSCISEGGRLVNITAPDKLLPRIQVLEYLRAFLLGRMAWSRLNGLLLISGAFGMFDKDIAIKAGGYNTQTVGEDMELVVRMRRYMEEPDFVAVAYKHVELANPVHDRREGFVFGVMRSFGIASKFPPLQIVMSPVLTLNAIGRWIAMVTSKIPQWPADVEAACAVADDDPYRKDSRDNVRLGFWDLWWPLICFVIGTIAVGWGIMWLVEKLAA